MHLLFIGSGFVGTTTAAAMADFGHSVLLYDIDANKIKKLGSRDRGQIESYLFEEGLADLLIKHQKRVSFTNDFAQVSASLDHIDAIFMCVPTPPQKDGSTNMSYYEKAIATIAQALGQRNKGKQTRYVVLINKSTVPIDTATYAYNVLAAHGVKNVGVVANPEFLVEGRAIEGNLRPTRIVVGADNKKDFTVMRRLYAHFLKKKDVLYIETNQFEAAAGKLLANYLLFSRLMLCFDVMGRVSESFDNLQFENIRKIVCSDPRIGFWGFYDSLYAGGSCLDKDANSLAYQLKQKKANVDIIKATIKANHGQLEHFLARIEKEAGMDVRGKVVALYGLAFKRDTNDMRNSAGGFVLEWLHKQGAAAVRVYDPSVAAEAIQALPIASSLPITVAKNMRDALTETHCTIIATDWPQFKTLATLIPKHTKKGYLIIDGRRSLADALGALQKKGYPVLAVGSPFFPAK